MFCKLSRLVSQMDSTSNKHVNKMRHCTHDKLLKIVQLLYETQKNTKNCVIFHSNLQVAQSADDWNYDQRVRKGPTVAGGAELSPK